MDTIEVKYSDLRRLASAAWTYHYQKHSSPAEEDWFIKFELCPMENCASWRSVLDKYGVK